MSIKEHFNNKEEMSKIILLFIMIPLLFLSIYIWSFIDNKQLDSNKVIDFYFLKLNEADSTIIKYKNNVIVIDTGEEKHEDKIKDKLDDLKVTSIDYMILSHPDKDHIGSAKYLIENFEVKNIVQSSFQKGSTIQEDLDKVIANKNINNLLLQELQEITIDDMKITFIPGKKKAYKKDNDYSIVTLINYYDNSFFFGGDIEESRIEEILELELNTFDVVKVPHHGRYNYLSNSLLKNLNPKYAIITAGTTDKKILNELRKMRTKVYFTKYYEVNIKCDGTNIQVESRG